MVWIACSKCFREDSEIHRFIHCSNQKSVWALNYTPRSIYRDLVGLVSDNFPGLWNMLEIICYEVPWIWSGFNKRVWWINESENWRLNFPYISDISKYLDYNLRTINYWDKDYLNQVIARHYNIIMNPIIQMQFMGLELTFEKEKLSYTFVHSPQKCRSARTLWD